MAERKLFYFHANIIQRKVIQKYFYFTFKGFLLYVDKQSHIHLTLRNNHQRKSYNIR